MLRTMIKIDQNLCNGCGLCVSACHEGALGMEAGKAVLLREDYCDGLGDCLPACPTGAISFQEREAPAYDHAAVAAAQAAQVAASSAPCGCPGSRSQTLPPPPDTAAHDRGPLPSQLRHWPVQLKLAPVGAPWLQGAHLLLAADCAAYAYGDFHRDFIKGRVVLVGCPKLDGVDYTEKLTAILAQNEIHSLTVARMEVPCCGGLQRAAEQALAASGKQLPLGVSVIGVDGALRRGE